MTQNASLRCRRGYSRADSPQIVVAQRETSRSAAGRQPTSVTCKPVLPVGVVVVLGCGGRAGARWCGARRVGRDDTFAVVAWVGKLMLAPLVIGCARAAVADRCRRLAAAGGARSWCWLVFFGCAR
jgi:hypothetical protein